MIKPFWIAGILLCACSAAPAEQPGKENRFDGRKDILPTILETNHDIDRHGGEWVKLAGRFEPLRFTHGLLTLDSGLIVLIPDFDRFKAGDDWLKYAGKRVAVGGRLVSHPHQIADRTGPSIIIDYFEPLERIR